MKQNKEPLVHLVKRDNIAPWKPWVIRAASIIGGLIFICLLCFAELKVSPFKVIKYMFVGAFGTEHNILVMFRQMSLLLIIALAITPAFKMRFWNIGAEGQVLIGAFGACACMFYCGGKMSNAGLIVLMLVVSIVAGVIWAVIPALFKAKWNTNETLFTLMMNYIALQVVLYFIKVWVPGGSGSLNPIKYGNLPQIAGGDYYFSMIFAAVITVAMFCYLRFSKHGYEITVVGESVNTAKYIGINVKKVIIRTLILSGAICGIAGFLIVAGIDHTISKDTVGGQGFTAVLVSWLAQFNPIAMVFTSFLVAFLTRGTQEVMTSSGITNNFFAQVVTGIMFIIILASEFLIRYQIVFRKKHKDSIGSAEPAQDTNVAVDTENASNEPIVQSAQEEEIIADSVENSTEKGVN